MTIKTKIFVTMAIIGAVVYATDLILSLTNGNIQPSMAFKVMLVSAFIYYAVKKIKGKKVHLKE
jgi:hypothetical protein